MFIFLFKWNIDLINTINKKNLKIESKKSHQINYAQKAVVMNIDIDNSGKIKVIKKNRKSFIANAIAEIVLDKLLINDRSFN